MKFIKDVRSLEGFTVEKMLIATSTDIRINLFSSFMVQSVFHIDFLKTNN